MPEPSKRAQSVRVHFVGFADTKVLARQLQHSGEHIELLIIVIAVGELQDTLRATV